MFDGGTHQPWRGKPTGKTDVPTQVEEQLMAYWLRLKHGREIPRRGDILPSDMTDFIDAACIIEKTPNGGARFRVAGQTFGDLLDMDVRGMPVHAIIAQNARAQFDHILSQVFLDTTKVSFALEARATYDYPLQKACFMALPLLDEVGTLTRAICVLDRGHATPIAPLRFDNVLNPNLESLGHFRLKPSLRMWEYSNGFGEPEPNSWISVPTPGQVGDEQSQAKMATRKSERPYLKLVKG